MLFVFVVQSLFLLVSSEDVYFGALHLCTLFNGTITYNEDMLIQTTVWKRDPRMHIARVYDMEANMYLYRLTVSGNSCANILTYLVFHPIYHKPVDLCAYSSCISKASKIPGRIF